MNNRLNDDVAFHMEQWTPESHSLSPEEFSNELQKKVDLASEGEMKFRKKYIEDILISNNINPSSVDINAILSGNIPEWFNKLDFNVISKNENISNNNFKYIRLTSNMIIKLDVNNLTGYKFDKENKVWIQDSSLIVEYENGNLHGEEIVFDDNFPTKNLEETNLRMRRL